MKYGLCCGQEGFALASGAGLDYAEPAFAALHNMDDEQIARIKRAAKDAGITIDGFNGFFGGEIMLHRDGVDEILSYAEKNFQIARMLDASYCVLGSGRNRAVPEGADREAAADRFRMLLDRIGTAGKKYGVRVYLEPLRYAESNLINTFSEGVEFCRGIGNDNVGCMLDLFHFFMNGEDLSVIDGLRPGELGHIHIARPNADRGCPRESDRQTIGEWAKKLKEYGYDGRISLEYVRGADQASELAEAAGVLKIFG